MFNDYIYTRIAPIIIPLRPPPVFQVGLLALLLGTDTLFFCAS